jgi:hypothetical protein
MANMLQIEGKVKIGGLLAAFVSLRKIDVKRVLLGLRKPMHSDQRDHRDRQRGPRGLWAPLASSTLKRYAREGKRRNRRILAKLPNARQTSVKGNVLTMKSRVRWSMAHQDGPTRVGRGAIVPQRQFLWISPSLHREATQHFRNALRLRWHAMWNGSP